MTSRGQTELENHKHLTAVIVLLLSNLLFLSVLVSVSQLGAHGGV